MIFHNGVIVSVDAIVGVLGVNAWSPALDPERFDLLVFEMVVEVHVATEDVFDSTAVEGLVGRLVQMQI